MSEQKMQHKILKQIVSNTYDIVKLGNR